MSETIVDMAKVTQMLDAGWSVKLFRGGMNSYVAIGVHPNDVVMAKLALRPIPDGYPLDDFWVDDDGECTTDDFTPEQALTRLAYKVHGEVLDS